MAENLFNLGICLLTLISVLSLAAIPFPLTSFCSSSCLLVASILHGRDSSEVFHWQQLITTQTSFLILIPLIELLLTVASPFEVVFLEFS